MPLRLLAAMMLASIGAGPPIVVPLASVTWMPSPTLPRFGAAARPVSALIPGVLLIAPKSSSAACVVKMLE